MATEGFRKRADGNDPSPVRPEHEALGDRPPRVPVFLWDPERRHAADVDAAVREAGGDPCWLAGGFPPDSPADGVAVVRLADDPSSEQPAAAILQQARARSLEVAAWSPAAALWSLGARSRLLLQGAASLLDGRDAAFLAELRRFLRRSVPAAAQLAQERRRATERMGGLGFAGSPAGLLDAFRSATKISVLSDLPALVTGETGTGKELMARAIHALDGKRAAGPFVALNCGALPASLAEAELFGHRRGAFTGAERERPGLIRSAHSGVLFLDEIGEMDPALQTKLLRVIQEGRVLSIGDDRETPVDVRIIAATHQDLRELMRRGRFREDLFHRLNVLRVQLPPLRERRGDLAPLVEHLLRKHASLCPDGPPVAAPEFLEALRRLRLPGNVRELENLLRHALLHRKAGEELTLGELPPDAWRELADTTEAAPAAPPAASIAGVLDLHDWNLSRSLRHMEGLLLEAALERTKGNQARTARLLGITPRSVYTKIRRHGLQP